MILLRYSLLVRLGLGLRRFFLFLADAIVTPQLALFDRSIGLSETLLLKVVSELRIADLIDQRAYTLPELAQATQTNPDVLRRILKALSDRGIFRCHEDGRLTHTRLSKALRKDHPSALFAWTQYFGSESNVKAWADLKTSAVDGKSAFDRIHGETVWDYFAKHPHEQETFAQGMMGVTRSQAVVILSLYDFSAHEVICDIGGGRGTLLSSLLGAYPALKAILYDADGVLESAEVFLREQGVRDRVRFESGNFFESVPQGADSYLLKNILHDWDDEVCLLILKNLRRVLQPAQKLIVMEQLLKEYEPNRIASFSDLQMLMSCSNGRERSENDFQDLFAKAGFRLVSVRKHPIVSVLVAEADFNP